MKTIALTQGRLTIVDDIDYEILINNRWCYHGGYAVRGQRKGGTNQLIRMHNYLMGTPKGMVTDHVNGNKLDNRRANLRVVTGAQNGINRGPNKNNKSGYKGVSKVGVGNRMKTKQWIAAIKVNYKKIPLGYYVTPEEAALAYNQAALKYFGEYAFQNVIQS